MLGLISTPEELPEASNCSQTPSHSIYMWEGGKFMHQVRQNRGRYHCISDENGARESCNQKTTSCSICIRFGKQIEYEDNKFRDSHEF